MQGSNHGNSWVDDCECGFEVGVRRRRTRSGPNILSFTFRLNETKCTPFTRSLRGPFPVSVPTKERMFVYHWVFGLSFSPPAFWPSNLFTPARPGRDPQPGEERTPRAIWTNDLLVFGVFVFLFYLNFFCQTFYLSNDKPMCQAS